MSPFNPHEDQDLSETDHNVEETPKTIPHSSFKKKTKMIRGEKRYTEEYCASILVTGGCGFVGSHIVEALLAEGRYVVIYDMFNSETSSCAEKHDNAAFLQGEAEKHKNKGAQLTIVDGNIRNGARIAQVVEEHDITACIHMAGMVDDRRSVHFPEEYLENNVLGTSCLLDTLGKCGVKMVVQPSTRSVFGANDQALSLTECMDRRPINPYGASKVATDALGHCYSYLHDMNVTLVRIFATYGPRGRPDMLPRILVEAMVKGKPIKKFGDGSATRTWTYISDVVRAFLLALRHPQGGFEEFHTGAPNITTLNEMIACAEQVSGKKAIIHQYPTPPGDPHQVGHPNYDKIYEAMGWKPQVSVLEGMRECYAYYKAKHEREMVLSSEEEPMTPEQIPVPGVQYKMFNKMMAASSLKVPDILTASPHSSLAFPEAPSL